MRICTKKKRGCMFKIKNCKNCRRRSGLICVKTKQQIDLNDWCGAHRPLQNESSNINMGLYSAAYEAIHHAKANSMKNFKIEVGSDSVLLFSKDDLVGKFDF